MEWLVLVRLRVKEFSAYRPQHVLRTKKACWSRGVTQDLTNNQKALQSLL